MKPTLPLQAAVAWSTLGLQWLEMMSASGHVIARRTRRAATPAQLFGMGSEKALAAMQSSHAMTRRLIAFPTTASDPFVIWNAWARLLASGLAPYRARAVRNARSGLRQR